MEGAEKITILTINRSDTRGGAATVGWNLFSHFHKIGLSSWYAVQYKFSNHDHVLTIDNEKHFGRWRKMIGRLQQWLIKNSTAVQGLWRLAKSLDWIGDPIGKVKVELGIEEFNYRGSHRILSRLPRQPDIVHAHVLHGGFFDLDYLGRLSNNVPVVFTLHDAWMLSGHCAHSFDCERWKTGCGHCPDLTIPKAIKRDNSALNWRRKKKIYEHSKFYISTPCQWLMNKVKESTLASACVETRVIPYGVNHDIFFPSSRLESRKVLGIEEGAFVFLFSANGIRRNRWKDFELMKRALALVAEEQHEKKIIFLALGENAAPEKIGNAEILYMPYRSDPKSVADFYRASDIYLHASKADTFPNAILEALSCGTPVIGTSVGGIPEQIKGWNGSGISNSALNLFDLNLATGVVIEAGDSESFAQAMSILMRDNVVRHRLGENAAADAKYRFPIKKQIQAYLDWYKEILARNK